jgi:hypothetical protein
MGFYLFVIGQSHENNFVDGINNPVFSVGWQKFRVTPIFDLNDY